MKAIYLYINLCTSHFHRFSILFHSHRRWCNSHTTNHSSGVKLKWLYLITDYMHFVVLWDTNPSSQGSEHISKTTFPEAFLWHVLPSLSSHNCFFVISGSVCLVSISYQERFDCPMPCSGDCIWGRDTVPVIRQNRWHHHHRGKSRENFTEPKLHRDVCSCCLCIPTSIKHGIEVPCEDIQVNVSSEKKKGE